MQKRAFYPVEDVERELERVPRGQISERVNDLIMKGLSYEKQEQLRLAYLKYDNELAIAPPRAKNESGVSSTMLMSEKAFEPEDEEEDFI